MASPTTVSSPARPFTFEDLEGMPDDGYRREIIGGSLIVNPAPNPRHQIAVLRLAALLLAAQPPGTQTVTAPCDWRPGSDDVFEPDILVFRLDDLDDRGFLRHGTVPVLAVEVLSPSNRAYDLVTKRAAYEAAGLASYWVIDPDERTLLALRLGGDGTYEVEAEAGTGSVLRADEPFDVTVPVADLFLQ